ncbi:unnamed protein product [Rotaria sordida]|uniref:Uncharacterized protein n=1 Tax=Rotaria sordida TaxID=392033 RepID=A0A814NEA4_9BILA|nr:unnamed protein product [Rotaria sordida]CAF1335485.1 unnamed protein product [Rotaria sordida]CAF1374768.1 unnamed protein product [Rotaria sordida]
MAQPDMHVAMPGNVNGYSEPNHFIIWLDKHIGKPGDSGSKGRIIVPSLVANFPETFVVGHWMYIFCANMNMVYVKGAEPPTNTWALQYLDHVLMFDHQDDLLARMLLDIGHYFFAEGKRLANEEHLYSACQHYEWSKKMYRRYEITEEKKKSTEIGEIDEHIRDVEQRLNPPNDDDDDRVGESAS